MASNNYQRFMNDGRTKGRTYVPEVMDPVVNAGDGIPGLQRCINNIISSTRKGHVLDGCIVSGDGITTGHVNVAGRIHDMVALADASDIISTGQVLAVDSTGTYVALAPSASMDNYCPIAYSTGTGLYNVGHRYHAGTYYRSFADMTLFNSAFRIKDTADPEVSLFTLGKGSGTFGQMVMGTNAGNKIVLDADPSGPTINVSGAVVSDAVHTLQISREGIDDVYIDVGETNVKIHTGTDYYIDMQSDQIVLKAGGTTLTVSDTGVVVE